MSMHPVPPATPAAGYTLASRHMHLVVQAEAIAVPRRHDPLRLQVTGSRDFTDMPAVAAVMWGIALTHGPLHITEGGATGLDSLAQGFAEQSGWTWDTIEARWGDPCTPGCNHGQRRWSNRYGSYCPFQGKVRNQAMVDKGHDLCVGWLSRPQSPGTLDCLARAHQAGIPTYTVMWEEADLSHDARWAVRRFLAR